MDPMKYTVEQLIRALVDQTMGEANFDDVYQVDKTNAYDPSALDMADNLYHQLKGLRVESEQAQEVLDRLRPELDKFSHYPAANQLLDSIEQVVWKKYRDDPKPIAAIVVQALNSKAADDWYANMRKNR
jgi:hypothetical protein